MVDQDGNPIRESSRYFLSPRVRGTGSRVPLDTGPAVVVVDSSDLVRRETFNRGIMFDDFLEFDTASRWNVWTPGTGAFVSTTGLTAGSPVTFTEPGAIRIFAGTAASEVCTIAHKNNSMLRVQPGSGFEIHAYWEPQAGGKLRFGFAKTNAGDGPPGAAPYLYVEADDETVTRYATLMSASSTGVATPYSTGLPVANAILLKMRVEIETSTTARFRMYGAGFDFDGGVLDTTKLPVAVEDVGFFVQIENGPAVGFNVVDIDYVAMWGV